MIQSKNLCFYDIPIGFICACMRTCVSKCQGVVVLRKERRIKDRTKRSGGRLLIFFFFFINLNNPHRDYGKMFI